MELFGIAVSSKLHKSYDLPIHDNHLKIVNIYFNISIFLFKVNERCKKCTSRLII